MKIKIFKQNIKEDLLRLKKIAQKEGWKFEYDKETDSLYFTPKKIPSSTRLLNISKEFAIYALPSGRIKGLLIEYFSSNFVQHKPEFKEFLDSFQESKDGFSTFEKGDKEKEKHFEIDLQKTIELDIYNEEISFDKILTVK